MPLQSYAHFAADDLLSEVVLERMLAGVATRRHARIAKPVGKEVIDSARSTGRSAVSRQFVKQTETALAELLARDLTGKDIKVLMLDGEHGTCAFVMSSRCVRANCEPTEPAQPRTSDGRQPATCRLTS